MIDALCHLELCEDPTRAVRLAARVGVSVMVSAGVDPRTDNPLPALPTVPRVLRAAGIHPQAVNDAQLDEQLAALERRLDEPGMVALGECGLDARAGGPPANVQERALLAQLAIAARRGLPVVLHLVRATARGLDCVEQSKVRRGVWHGFAGPREAIAPALRLGLYLSVGGLVLNQGARRLRAAVAHIPPDRLLVETDAPELPPERLIDVIAEVAKLRGESAGAIDERTSANASALYGV